MPHRNICYDFIEAIKIKLIQEAEGDTENYSKVLYRQELTLT